MSEIIYQLPVPWIVIEKEGRIFLQTASLVRSRVPDSDNSSPFESFPVDERGFVYDDPVDVYGARDDVPYVHIVKSGESVNVYSMPFLQAVEILQATSFGNDNAGLYNALCGEIERLGGTIDTTAPEEASLALCRVERKAEYVNRYTAKRFEDSLPLLVYADCNKTITERARIIIDELDDFLKYFPLPRKIYIHIHDDVNKDPHAVEKAILANKEWVTRYHLEPED